MQYTSRDTALSARGVHRRPLWLSLAGFLIVFFVLQYGWDVARGSWLERWVIDDATVGTGVAAIHVLTPQLAAVARGASILAPGGGINVRNGCEGTEVYFLLVAAIMTYPFRPRLRLAGLVAGMGLVFVLNQARLLALFYAFRENRALFDATHGTIAPLILIAFTLAFFLLLIRLDHRSHAAPAAHA